MKKFFITYTGCARRQLDCERLKNYFIENKFKLVNSPEEADYIFISTCGLTKLKENMSINKILESKKFNGEIIVCGCLPSMNMKRIKEVFDGEIINTKSLGEIDKFFPGFSIKFNDIPDPNKVFIYTNKQRILQFIQKLDIFYPIQFFNRILFLKKIRKKSLRYVPPAIDFNNNFLTLRISSGCLGNCSYCNIRKSIGNLKSKPLSAVLGELRNGISNKKNKINILSSDTGAYGLDICSNLPQLLKAILAENGNVSIKFIQDLHPHWICRYKSQLIELIKTKRIKSILTAVQSGSERILKLMKRSTNLSKFKETLIEMKRAYPSLRLGTQIIVGFPTETEQDFQDTINFVRDCQFDEVGVFCYHETETQDSVKIKPKIPPSVIEDRIDRINLPNRVIVHIWD